MNFISAMTQSPIFLLITMQLMLLLLASSITLFFLYRSAKARNQNLLEKTRTAMAHAAALLQQERQRAASDATLNQQTMAEPDSSSAELEEKLGAIEAEWKTCADALKQVYEDLIATALHSTKREELIALIDKHQNQALAMSAIITTQVHSPVDASGRLLDAPPLAQGSIQTEVLQDEEATVEEAAADEAMLDQETVDEVQQNSIDEKVTEQSTEEGVEESTEENIDDGIDQLLADDEDTELENEISDISDDELDKLINNNALADTPEQEDTNTDDIDALLAESQAEAANEEEEASTTSDDIEQLLAEAQSLEAEQDLEDTTTDTPEDLSPIDVSPDDVESLLADHQAAEHDAQSQDQSETTVDKAIDEAIDKTIDESSSELNSKDSDETASLDLSNADSAETLLTATDEPSVDELLDELLGDVFDEADHNVKSNEKAQAADDEDDNEAIIDDLDDLLGGLGLDNDTVAEKELTDMIAQIKEDPVEDTDTPVESITDESETDVDTDKKGLSGQKKPKDLDQDALLDDFINDQGLTADDEDDLIL